MKVKLLSPAEWAIAKEKLIAFFIRFGDSRITAVGIKALQELSPASLSSTEAGSAVVVAIEDGKLAACAVAVDAGEQACLIVVRSEMRGKGFATLLLRALKSHCGRLTCNVATDNSASMQACFRSGMKAVSLHQGPTGKSTLRFES
ncbi:hypothetical protein Back11_28420 [Paenibacillus baekrokdamisoli]|uniref:Uncharacterized protein n=1 Tax=Paenibacillus baekrokdamisoli TaxID=1712516 RepID=A0A3G9IRK2_9BACL|nr:GNAT family N-acetyltransferase [Paenibacillus baekrokdamisoli]MBB3071080.1 GNAT superfamily N-acetyltransferase [Paenibacillus baekrokdamisoli]BBH21497.1 hypothetical protein Back11_28420 [Paenibacillus baekrokdamisoli]